MTVVLSENSSNLKRSRIATRTAVKKPAQSQKQSSRTSLKGPAKDEPRRARETKHGKLLALLSRPNGASIDEMMQATDWQQHSVRGFLAGTVKKKMGLALTSTRAEGELRRYRIATRRGR